MKKTFDLSAYFIVGPENTLGRDPLTIIEAAIDGGFSFIQIRSKKATAQELIHLAIDASKLIKKKGKENRVRLVINDRLDVALAAKVKGAKIDGIHVGQDDIPVDVCRKYLGKEAIIGLSAPTQKLLDYVGKMDTSNIDYLGAGPLHETDSKPECGLDKDGKRHLRTSNELSELIRISPLPVVVGGGVKEEDLNTLAQCGVDGFFVISAVSQARDPFKAAKALVNRWRESVESL